MCAGLFVLQPARTSSEDRMSSYLADAARAATPGVSGKCMEVPHHGVSLYSIRRQQQLAHGQELKLQAQAQQRQRESERRSAMQERRVAAATQHRQQ